MGNIFDIFNKIATEATPAEPVSFIIAGLGNPGKQYVDNRHNAGFMCIEMMMRKYGFRLDRTRFHALCGETVISGRHILVMEPQTFMNASGTAVREAAAFYKLPPSAVIVISDDVSLDVGSIRIRRKGSDGGHNGLKSIIEQLGDEGFPRVRIGVGKKPVPEYDLAAWVLGDIPQNLRETFCKSLDDACSAVGDIVGGGIDAAMNKYN